MYDSEIDELKMTI